MDNTSKQAEEMEVLSSIYGEDWKNDSDGMLSFRFNMSEANRDVTLIFNLPENYPSQAPPSFEMSAPSLTTNQKNEINRALNEVYFENLGETVIYQWIEKVREFLQSLPKIDSTVPRNKKEETLVIREEVWLFYVEYIFVNVSSAINWLTLLWELCILQKTARPVKAPNTYLPCPEIIHGEIIEDKKSHFQGHVARIKSPEDVKVVLSYLNCERKIATATHNILAWKCGEHQDYDSDGEKGAGGRLLKLIDVLKVDNVIVVVSRWYGGTHLGMDRFRHINNAARKTFVLAGIIPR